MKDGTKFVDAVQEDAQGARRPLRAGDDRRRRAGHDRRRQAGPAARRSASAKTRTSSPPTSRRCSPTRATSSISRMASTPSSIRRASRSSTSNDQPVERAPKKILWDAVMAEKEGYRHYMLKEIHEQPRAVRDTFTGRMFEESGEIFFNDLQLTPDEWAKIKTRPHRRLRHVVALGTGRQVPARRAPRGFRSKSTTAPSTATAIRSSTRTRWSSASRSRARPPTRSPACRRRRAKGAKLITICNVIGAAATRMSDGVIYTNAGPEIGVASTKAFTTQLTAFYLLVALHPPAARRRPRRPPLRDARDARDPAQDRGHPDEAGEAHRGARAQVLTTRRTSSSSAAACTTRSRSKAR